MKYLKLIIIGLLFLLSCSKDHYLTHIKEIDTKLFINSKGNIFLSLKDDSKYQIATWQNQSISIPIKSGDDLFSPFYYKNEIYALYDNNGDENWRTTHPDLNARLQNRYLERIESDKTGELIVFQPKHTNVLFLLDAKTGDVQKISDIKVQYHNTIFDQDNQRIFISLDDKIIVCDLTTWRAKPILAGVLGEKLNIFLFGDDLYFNSNDTSEYHQIYKYSLNGENVRPILVHKGLSDVMMPKLINGALYFIQCVQNHYQLRRRVGNSDDIITETGVVYQYCSCTDNRILFSYSDFNLPKSLMQYYIRENKIENLTGEVCQLDVRIEYQPMRGALSSAYKIIPDRNKKGIVLFFHPDLNGDFSPRWDTILMNLAQNGYEIVCPNYPMSFGYGKQYNDAQFQDAINDMIAWKDKLTRDSDNNPLYLLSSSSGNLLMEVVLYFNNRGINGAISLFGLFNPRVPLANIPQLFVLGENDPKVNITERTALISKSGNQNIKVVSLENEGHWVRNNHNNSQILDVIMSFIR